MDETVRVVVEQGESFVGWVPGLFVLCLVLLWLALGVGVDG